MTGKLAVLENDVINALKKGSKKSMNHQRNEEIINTL